MFTFLNLLNAMENIIVSSKLVPFKQNLIFFKFIYLIIFIAIFFMFLDFYATYLFDQLSRNYSVAETI